MPVSLEMRCNTDHTLLMRCFPEIYSYGEGGLKLAGGKTRPAVNQNESPKYHQPRTYALTFLQRAGAVAQHGDWLGMISDIWRRMEVGNALSSRPEDQAQPGPWRKYPMLALQNGANSSWPLCANC